MTHTSQALLLVSLFWWCLLSCTQAPKTIEESPTSEPIAALSSSEIAAPPLDTTITKSYLMGKFDPASHPDFVVVDSKYTDGGQIYYLRQEAYAAFRKMHAAAAADGVNLRIISATRNFDRQKAIWEAKWRGERLLEGTERAPEVYPLARDRALAILRYSSMPGTSRHHWGTDMDFNDLNNRFFESGEGKRIFDWLTVNGATYGFCQPYSPKGPERPHGYNEERWHWSYLPLAQPLTAFAEAKLKDSDIGGFEGAEAAREISVVKHYVLGIRPACMPPR